MMSFVLKLEIGADEAEIRVEGNGAVAITGLDMRRQLRKKLQRFVESRIADGVLARTSCTVSGDNLECLRLVSADEEVFPQVLCDAINEERLECGSVVAFVPSLLTVDEPDVTLRDDILKQLLPVGEKRMPWRVLDAIDPVLIQRIGRYALDGSYVIELPKSIISEDVAYARIKGGNFFGYAMNNEIAAMTGLAGKSVPQTEEARMTA